MKRAVPQYFPSQSDGGKGYTIMTPASASAANYGHGLSSGSQRMDGQRSSSGLNSARRELSSIDNVNELNNGGHGHYIRQMEHSSNENQHRQQQPNHEFYQPRGDFEHPPQNIHHRTHNHHQQSIATTTVHTHTHLNDFHPHYHPPYHPPYHPHYHQHQQYQQYQQYQIHKNGQHKNNLLMFRDVNPAIEEDDGKSLNTQWSQRHLLRNQRERIASDVLSQKSGSTTTTSQKHQQEEFGEQQHKHQHQHQHQHQSSQNHTRRRRNNPINPGWSKDVVNVDNNETQKEKENQIQINSNHRQQQQQQHPPHLASSLYSPIAVLKIKNKSKNKKKKPYLKSKPNPPKLSSTLLSPSSSSSRGKKKDEYLQQQAQQQQHHQQRFINFNLNHNTTNRIRTRATYHDLTKGGNHISNDPNARFQKNSNLYQHQHQHQNQHSHKNNPISPTTKVTIPNKRQYKIWNEDSVDNENFSIATKSINSQSNKKSEMNDNVTNGQPDETSNKQQQQQHQQQPRQSQSSSNMQQQYKNHSLAEDYDVNHHHQQKHNQKKTASSARLNYNNNRSPEQRLLSSHDEMSPLHSTMPTTNNNSTITINHDKKKITPLSFTNATLKSNSKPSSSTLLQSSSYPSPQQQKMNDTKVAYNKMTAKTAQKQEKEQGSLLSFVSPMYAQSNSHDEMSPIDVRLGIRPNNYYSEEQSLNSSSCIGIGTSTGAKRNNANHQHPWRRSPFRKEVNRDVPLSQQSDQCDEEDDENISRDFIDPNRGEGFVLKEKHRNNGVMSSSLSSLGGRNVGQGYRYSATDIARNDNTKIRLSMRELTRGGKDVIERRATQFHKKKEEESQGIRSQRDTSKDVKMKNISSVRNKNKNQNHEHAIKKPIEDKSSNKSSDQYVNRIRSKHTNNVQKQEVGQRKEESHHIQSLQQRRRHHHPNLTVDTTQAERPSKKIQATENDPSTPTKQKSKKNETKPFDLQSKVDESWAPSPIKLEGSFAILKDKEKKSKSSKVKLSRGSISQKSNHRLKQKEDGFMREVAAIVIQTFFRRHLAYRLTIERYSAVITIQRFFRSIIDDEKAKRQVMENSITMLYDLAAVEIQRIWRGWWVRDCINVDNYCASVIQRNTLVYLLKCRIEKKRLAAILIQKRWRGYAVRKVGLRRRRSLQKARNKTISHSEKTLKTGTITRPKNQSNAQMKTNTRTIRVFSKLSTGGSSKQSGIQRKKGNRTQSSSIVDQQKSIPMSYGGPSKPKTVQRKTSKESQTSSQRMAVMHSEDMVWKWKMMRERNKEGSKLAEF